MIDESRVGEIFNLNSAIVFNQPHWAAFGTKFAGPPFVSASGCQAGPSRVELRLAGRLLSPAGDSREGPKINGFY